MPPRTPESLLTFMLCCVMYVQGSDQNMKSLMELHQVVPDLISVAPELTLDVVYDGEITVENGIELTPTQVKNQPTITWNPEPDTFYTLMLLSPDAPSRDKPKMKDLQLWMVVNIPGNDISKGDVLTEFIGVGPPIRTGLHRYIFLLYKQPAKTSFNEDPISKTTSKGRFYFSTQKFVDKYSLDVPIAGNFFQAQYDDYVPEVHKQLGVVFDT